MLILCFSILLNLFPQNQTNNETSSLKDFYLNVLNNNVYFGLNGFTDYEKMEADKKRAELINFSKKYNFERYNNIYFYFLNIFKEKLKEENYQLPLLLEDVHLKANIPHFSNELLNIMKRREYEELNNSTDWKTKLFYNREDNTYFKLVDSSDCIEIFKYPGILEDYYLFDIEEAYSVFKTLYLIKNNFNAFSDLVIKYMKIEILDIDFNSLKQMMLTIDDNERFVDRIIKKYQKFFDNNLDLESCRIDNTIVSSSVGEYILINKNDEDEIEKVFFNYIDKVYFLRSIYDLFRRPDYFKHI